MENSNIGVVNEVEVKFKIDDVASYENKIKSLGVEFVKDTEEINYCYDNSDNKIVINDELLRIRKVSEKFNNKEISYKTILTFKGAKKLGSELKEREELELEVSNAEMLSLIFERLGFKATTIYEKKRKTYNYKNSEIVIDKLPKLGFFLEIEGKREEIFEICSSLNLNINDSVKDSYAEFASKAGNLKFNKGD